MKIINNFFPQVDPFRMGVHKAKSVAFAKRDARKRDRARMRQLTVSELVAHHLDEVAEASEQFQQACEAEFHAFMRRLNHPAPKHARGGSRRKQVRTVNQHLYSGEGEPRNDFIIVVPGGTGESQRIASVAA